MSNNKVEATYYPAEQPTKMVMRYSAKLVFAAAMGTMLGLFLQIYLAGPTPVGFAATGAAALVALGTMFVPQKEVYA